MESKVTNLLADRIWKKSKELKWNERGIKEDHPEVKVEILIVKVEELEKRLEALQKACGVDNIRISNLESGAI